MLVQPNPLPDTDQKPLPLFRAEAVAAQQQKYYGEILLIRPLSLALLFWLGMGISALVLVFLLLGTYTEKIRVAGILLPADGATGQAVVYVPGTAVKFVRVGEAVPFRCQSCVGGRSQTRSASVSDISKSSLSPEEVAAQSKLPVQGPMYRITLMLPAEAAPFPEGARIEAELPEGRKPLLRWLLERGS